MDKEFYIAYYSCEYTKKVFVERFWLPENVSMHKKLHYKLLEHNTLHSRRDCIFSWGSSKGRSAIKCKWSKYRWEIQMKLYLQFLETKISKFWIPTIENIYIYPVNKFYVYVFWYLGEDVFFLFRKLQNKDGSIEWATSWASSEACFRLA